MCGKEKHRKSFKITPSNATTIYQKQAVSKVGFFFLALLIASFAYELPLASVTRYDRLNPRLFDIAAVLLMLYWFFFGRFRGWRIKVKRPVIWPWMWVTFFFGIATLFSVLWIPTQKYLYSIFFFLKYLEALVVILIVASVPFDEKDISRLLWVALFGGLWVSVYALLQFLGVVSTTRYLPSGEEIAQFKQGIYSSLGVTYFHVGMFSVLSCIVGFTLFVSTEGLKKGAAAIMALFCVIPAVVSGSKAGALGLVIALCLISAQKRYRTKLSIYLLVILLGGTGVYFYNRSITKERLEQGRGGTPYQRLLAGPFKLKQIFRDHGIKLLAVGGGFYVVPEKKGSKWEVSKEKNKYRIGYGNHNIFLFPLEQAGLGAFLASIWLWYSIAKGLKKRSKSLTGSGFIPSFATSMWVYFVALVIVGLGGQVFWLGFGTEHFTIYQLLMFIMAACHSEYTTEKGVIQGRSLFSI